MPIRIVSIKGSLSAGASETTIGSITVKVGYTYNVLEVLPLVPSGCRLYIYIESDRYADIDGDIIAKDNRRIVVNWSLTGGQKLTVSGINPTTSAQTLGAIIVYEETAA
jgi:hypothetical protein